MSFMYKGSELESDIYNFDLNNLILVSNAEELILNNNGLIKQDQDLTKTGVLIAKVLNKTSKLKKVI